MKATLVLFSLFFCFAAIAQKDGKYLPADHPANQLWEFDGDKDVAAPIAGMPQQFFFLLPDGSEKSMMAPFEMEGMGFACPTSFKVSVKANYLYLDISEACDLDLSEAEKYVKLQYKMDGDNLVLVVDGVDYKYREWGAESTEESKDAPTKMAIDRNSGKELLSMGGWHPASRDKLLFKGVHTLKIVGQDENGYDLIHVKGVDAKKQPFEMELRTEIMVDNDYLELSIHADDNKKLCAMIYCYFVDDNNAFFFFTNSWFESTDEGLKDQNWMQSRR